MLECDQYGQNNLSGNRPTVFSPNLRQPTLNGSIRARFSMYKIAVGLEQGTEQRFSGSCNGIWLRVRLFYASGH